MGLKLRRLCLLLLVHVAVVLHTVSTEQTVGDGRSSSGGADADDDSDILVIEEESDSFEEQRDVFVATKQWQVVKEGQAIPPGLHVRMNLQTGLKEAKLLDDEDVTNGGVDSASESTGASEDGDRERDDSDTDSSDSGSSSQTSEGMKFRGDHRRTHYFGKSDRRGIINKKTKVFSRKELLQSLHDEENNDNSAEHLLLTVQDSRDDEETVSVHATSHRELSDSLSVSVDQEESGRRRSELPYTLHEEVGMMLEHSQTLAKKNATVEELILALEELEYHVHNLDNAKDLNAIGGLVLVIRQLNHSSPEVRSNAAHVIGAASQSNPTLQQQVFDYGGLEHLCSLISTAEPDLVQRRSLFALSSLLRGNIRHQLLFLEQCRGLEVLGKSFNERSTQVQLKAVTLLTDIMSEQQEQALRSKGKANLVSSVLEKNILEHGWCEHVSTPIHSEEGTRIEKGLEAMTTLQKTCDFTGQVRQLKKLAKQFESILDEGEQRESAEFTELLLDYSRTLLKTIRQQNLDL